MACRRGFNFNYYWNTRLLRHSSITTNPGSKLSKITGSETVEVPSNPSRQLSSRPHPTVEQVIRVSHAGEFAAHKIYKGQALKLSNSSVGPDIQVQLGRVDNHVCDTCYVILVCDTCYVILAL